jgi:hypothetical protein
MALAAASYDAARMVGTTGAANFPLVAKNDCLGQCYRAADKGLGFPPPRPTWRARLALAGSTLLTQLRVAGSAKASIEQTI